ncbi:MAG: DnaJ domain-containing protein [Oscillospiraceae bacterium]|jgi:hypothetical protein|nr:DnaJ domain-containing protein [Oscillospiraceae bacterium]
MVTLFESYKILGVKVGAGLTDVTTSYKQLCREHHPDISDDPEAEELMKQINIAYTILREKFKREAAIKNRQFSTRQPRRYPNTASHTPPYTPPQQTQTKKAEPNTNQHHQTTQAHWQKAAERTAMSAEAEVDARTVLHDYFQALNAYDFKKAYECLSTHDKKHITLEGFIAWRESVSRLHPLREFRIAGGSSVAVITWGDNRTFQTRKFRVEITEGDYSDSTTQSEGIDKLVINESGKWGVFLGYKEINELTRTFDNRFETKKKKDLEKRGEEYIAGFHTEYDMLNLSGMKKAVQKELYRQRRYGGSMTFTVIEVKRSGDNSTGQPELLRSAAKTINSSLREIDISAYAGDGVFAVLFVEMGRKNAENIISRLVDTIRKNAGSGLGENAVIEYYYESWSDNSYADMENINSNLSKFGKKM